tara:strand:+ start:629 stop:1192 length:564 start_codon:yes stop_codon:yes gene_type:complete
LRRDEHFVEDARTQLSGVRQAWDWGALVMTDEKPFPLILDCLIQELQGLPWNDEVGKTYLMRADAKNVVDDLIAYLQRQQTALKEGGDWDTSAEDVEWLFKGDREVFKNYIFKRHRMQGIGYNLDLSVTFDRKVPDKQTPCGFILERRRIDSRDGFSAHHDGFITLHLGGYIKVDWSQMAFRAHESF